MRIRGVRRQVLQLRLAEQVGQRAKRQVEGLVAVVGGGLGLFTNRMVLQRVGERLAPAFAARGIPLFWQGMPGLAKEEIIRRD